MALLVSKVPLRVGCIYTSPVHSAPYQATRQREKVRSIRPSKNSAENPAVLSQRSSNASKLDRSCCWRSLEQTHYIELLRAAAAAAAAAQFQSVVKRSSRRYTTSTGETLQDHLTTLRVVERWWIGIHKQSCSRKILKEITPQIYIHIYACEKRNNNVKLRQWIHHSRLFSFESIINKTGIDASTRSRINDEEFLVRFISSSNIQHTTQCLYVCGYFIT